MKPLLSLIFNTDEDPFALIDARIAFEPGAAVVSSRVGSKKDIKSLSSRIDRLRQALFADDIRTYRMEDQMFHLGIAQMTRNILIINTISSLLSAMEKPLWQTMKKSPGRHQTAQGQDERTRRYFSRDCSTGRTGHHHIGSDASRKFQVTLFCRRRHVLTFTGRKKYQQSPSL